MPPIFCLLSVSLLRVLYEQEVTKFLQRRRASTSKKVAQGVATTVQAIQTSSQEVSSNRAPCTQNNEPQTSNKSDEGTKVKPPVGFSAMQDALELFAFSCNQHVQNLEETHAIKSEVKQLLPAQPPFRKRVTH